ncbi:MAG TPA: SDR family oxidoreductase [Salinivirgaceae bacterium]|nr:SDR family oxidoreductase [Salinivirgaceae bacterium]
MKNIVISGVSQGIGFELVKKLHQNHQVFAITSHKEKAQTILPETNVTLLEIDYLTTDPFSASIPFPERVDILINNAGILINKPFEELTKEEIEKSLAVNFTGALRLIQRLIPNLKQSPTAHVVNIGSMGGFQGSSKYPGLSVYSATKGALAVLTESLASEYVNTNIRFNCLCLGAVQTEMLQQAFPGYQAPINPNGMAEFIIDFAFNGRNYFNGKILPVALSNP